MSKFEKGHKFSTKHGLNGTRIWKTWSSMRERCLCPSYHAYADYGGRGIKICERWDSLENFVADMGDRPDGMSLDRIDNSKGYSPDNCRWATREEQQNNTRAAHILEFNGERLSISQWSRKLGVSRNRIRTRIQRGMSVEDALTMPKMDSWTRGLRAKDELNQLCKNEKKDTK